METNKYEAIAQNYRDALAWMKTIGVTVDNNRAAQYAKTITYWSENYKSASNKVADEALPGFSSAALEIADFVEIHKSLGGLPIGLLDGIASKLKKAVSGPVSTADENTSNTTARNFLFEALAAARCYRPERGLETELSTNADSQIKFEGTDIFLECKRISSENKIESNAREASSQAVRHLSKTGTSGRAIVAFDITKLFDTHGKMYPYNRESDLHEFIRLSVERFIREKGHNWDKVYRRRDKRLIGTMLRYSHLAVDQNSNMLITVNNWSVLPRVGINTTNQQFLERMVLALNG